MRTLLISIAIVALIVIPNQTVAPTSASPGLAAIPPQSTLAQPLPQSTLSTVSSGTCSCVDCQCGDRCECSDGVCKCLDCANDKKEACDCGAGCDCGDNCPCGTKVAQSTLPAHFTYGATLSKATDRGLFLVTYNKFNQRLVGVHPGDALSCIADLDDYPANSVVISGPWQGRHVWYATVTEPTAVKVESALSDANKVYNGSKQTATPISQNVASSCATGG